MISNNTPSDKLHPNRQEDEQDMEMTPVVVGPPGYGSPKEKTQAGRLVALNEHPLSNDISPDYGKDALEAGGVVGADTAGETNPDDPNEMTVEQLDAKYGDHEDYLKSWNKDDKVKFAKKADKSEEE